ncbi:MAG TPA: hypothetical protein VFS59_00305 [Gemmatimonadaceae bacterium]|nr:hypothetical protein [Gemmatimonadaceae bacterium]
MGNHAPTVAVAVAIALAGAVACSRPDRTVPPRDSSVAHPGATARASALPAFETDTIVDGYGALDTLRLDSLRVEMARLEQELRRAPEGEHPPLLLELGRAKRLYIAPLDGPHAHYARTRPDEYVYDEIGGRFVYHGKHLRHLLERFPDHPLADDAAWQLTLLPSAGECEGFVVCYVEYRWRRVRDFLGAHPASPYAPRALDRAIAAFDEHLTSVTDLTRSSEFYDAGDLPPLVAEFDSVTAGLPAPLRERAAAFSSRLRRRMAPR